MITYILTKIKGKILGYYLFNINNNIANYHWKSPIFKN